MKVEALPWGQGKERMTFSYQTYLACWARRLSWKETADIFGTSRDTVFRAVKSVVDYGLARRSLDGVTEIGIDEMAVFTDHPYLTLIYPLNAGARRLIGYGSERRVKTLLRFFRKFGNKRSAQLNFVCSDLWAPFLKGIAKNAPQALNILDRFHIMRKIDEIRRNEVKPFKETHQQNILARSRWPLLERPENLAENQTVRMSELLKLNLASIKGDALCVRISKSSGTIHAQMRRKSFSITG
jgi:transposase